MGEKSKQFSKDLYCYNIPSTIDIRYWEQGVCENLRETAGQGKVVISNQIQVQESEKTEHPGYLASLGKGTHLFQLQNC